MKKLIDIIISLTSPFRVPGTIIFSQCRLFYTRKAKLQCASHSWLVYVSWINNHKNVKYVYWKTNKCNFETDPTSFFSAKCYLPFYTIDCFYIIFSNSITSWQHGPDTTSLVTASNEGLLHMSPAIARMLTSVRFLFQVHMGNEPGGVSVKWTFLYAKLEGTWRLCTYQRVIKLRCL